MEPADLHARLNMKDLRLMHAVLVENIVELSDEWEAGKFKDKDLDAYIDDLCAVRDKISKILNDPKLRTF